MNIRAFEKNRIGARCDTSLDNQDLLCNDRQHFQIDSTKIKRIFDERSLRSSSSYELELIET